MLGAFLAIGVLYSDKFVEWYENKLATDPYVILLLGIMFGKHGAEDDAVISEKIKCALSHDQYEDAKPIYDEYIASGRQASDLAQWNNIQSIADTLAKIDNDDNGETQSVFDITEMLDYVPEARTELVLNTSRTTADLTTKSYVRTILVDSEIGLKRDLDFSDAITKFERRGVRISEPVTTVTTSSFVRPDFTSIASLIASGIEPVEYDVVNTKNGGFYVDNTSPIFIGRHISSEFVEERQYSTNIEEVADISILEALSNNSFTNSGVELYHERFAEILMQSDLGFSEYKNITMEDARYRYGAIWYRLFERLGSLMAFNRFYTPAYMATINFSYPERDVLGYRDINKDSVELVNKISKLESEGYCIDTTPLRLASSISGVKYLIRIFIMERVLNTIQAVDAFHVDFMLSDVFIKAIYDDIRSELDKYQVAFGDLLEGDIYSDIKDISEKYYDILFQLGINNNELEGGNSIFKDMIETEVSLMSKTIVSSLAIGTEYHSLSWDDFVFDVLLTDGFIYSGVDEDGKNRFKEFASMLDGIVSSTSYYGDDDRGYTLVAEVSYNGSMLIKAECSGNVEFVEAEDCETTEVIDYSEVKQTLYQNEIYQDLISYVFPLKEAMALMSVYQASALSDTAVFSGTYEGQNLFDVFAKTKLSTLQTFLASIYGAGETTYIDPFLEKLKT